MERSVKYTEYTIDELYEILESIEETADRTKVLELRNEISRRKAYGEVPSAKYAPYEKYDTINARVMACGLDGIVFLPLDLVNRTIWKFAGSIPTDLLLVWYVFNGLSLYIYTVIMHGIWGQTVGKSLTKVKVLDVSEEKLSFKQAVLRDLVPIVLAIIFMAVSIPQIKQGVNPVDPEGNVFTQLTVVSIVVAWWVIELVTMLFNKKRRAVHDYIAGSVVIKIPQDHRGK